MTEPYIPLSPEELAVQAHRQAEEGGRVLTVSPEPRGLPAQAVVGAIRGPFMAAGQAARAVSLIPGLRAPATSTAQFIENIPPAAGEGVVERGIESATQSLTTGLGLFALGVTGPLALPLGVAGIFGAGEAAQTREYLGTINTQLVKSGQQPLSPTEVGEAMVVNAGVEFAFEGIANYLFTKRFGLGKQMDAAKAALRSSILSPRITNAALQKVARAGEEALRGAGREASTEAIQAGTQAAELQRVIGPARVATLEAQGVQVPTAGEAARSALGPAAVAGVFGAGVGVALGRRRAQPPPVVQGPTTEPSGSAAAETAIPTSTALVPFRAPATPQEPQAIPSPVQPQEAIDRLVVDDAGRFGVVFRNPFGLTEFRPSDTPVLAEGIPTAQISRDEYQTLFGTPEQGIAPDAIVTARRRFLQEEGLEGLVPDIAFPVATRQAVIPGLRQPLSPVAVLAQAEELALNFVIARQDQGLPDVRQSPQDYRAAIRQLALATEISTQEARRILDEALQSGGRIAQPRTAQPAEPTASGAAEMASPTPPTPVAPSVSPPTAVATPTAEGALTPASSPGVETPEQPAIPAPGTTPTEEPGPEETVYKGYTIRQVGPQSQVSDATGQVLFRASSPEGARARIDRLGLPEEPTGGQPVEPVTPTPPRPPTMADLATQIEQQGAATQAQIQRERVEAEQGTRLRPTVLQAEPTGMFEQTQALPFGIVTQTRTYPAQPAGKPDVELELQQFVRRKGGIRAEGSDVAGELRALASPRETGTTGLLNNKTGLSVGRMAEAAAEAGFIATADTQALLEALDRSVRQGHVVLSNQHPDALTAFPFGVGFEIREGERSDATPATRAMATATLQDLERTAQGRGYTVSSRGRGRVVPPGAPAVPGVRAAPKPLRFGIAQLAETRAFAYLRQLRQTATAAFQGQIIQGLEHLAVLGQGTRSVQVETLSVIAYDDTGQVRGVRAISSRLPARSQAFATTNAGFALYDPATDRVVGIAKTRKRARAYINLDNRRLESLESVEGKRQGRLEIRPNTQLGTDDWQELRQWMQAIGATQYALEHNHPSGNPTPSNDDVRMSQNFARELPGFQGHVVIDSGRYATISATGEVGMHDLPGDHSQDIYHPPPASLPEHMVAEDDTVVLPLTGINSPETIVQAAKGIMRQSATGPTDDQMVAVMYLNARPDMAGLEVRGMELVPEQTFHNERLMRMWLRQRTRHYGSKFTAAYYEGPVEAIHTAGDLLYQRGAINEFISGAQGTPALGSLKSFLPGLAGARSLEGVTPGFQVQEEEEVYGPLRLGEALPTTIEGVPVERVQKAVDEYMLLAGMADRTQTLGQLADATFARLKIKTATQLEIERNRLVRWLSLETAIPTLMKRAKTDPTFSMSAADIGAWKLFGEMLLDDINTKRLQGTLTPEHATTLQHEIYKTHGEVLTAGSSEAGRALKRMQQGGGPVMAFAEFMKRFKTRHPTASQEKLDAIGRKFTETFQQRGEPGLQELVLEELDPVALDYFWELYYGSILSGVPTHVVNTVGNLSYAVYHNGLVEGTMAALDWTIAGITGRQRTLYMRDVVAGMNAMWRSARPAYRDAWYWWKAPFPQAIGGAGGPVPFGAGIQRGAQMGGERQRHDWGAPAWAHATPESMPRFLPAHAKTALASWMRSFAPFIGAANRALNAADVAAKTLGGDATLAREASMEARRRFGANVTPEQEAAFLADVQAHLEQYPAIQAEVQRVGLDNTFNDAVSGIAQTVINARQWSQPFGFLARLTFPFAATPDRLIARGLELVPGVGFVVGTHEKGLRWNGFLPHLKAGDQAALEIAAKQLIGVALTMAAWWLWDQEKLTGTLSTNANERDSQLRRGLIPHAVILNGRAVEYRRFEPFHLPFGFVTTIFTAMRDLEHKRQREALEGIPAAEYVDDMMALAGLASSGMARFVLDSSYFSGLARFFQAVSPQGGSVGKGLSQQIASTVIPFVGLSRSVARALEASGVLPGTTAGEVAVREAAVPSQAILRNLPGAAVGVRERVDVFGRPVTTKTILGGPAAAGEVFFSPVRTAPVGQDAIDEDLARLRYFPQVPSKATLQQALHRRVSDEELQAFRLARGQLARQQLERLTQAAWFQDLPDERKRKRYQAVFRHATKQALRALQSPGSAQAVGLLEAG